MPFARHLQLATIDFMIGNPDPLPRDVALLALAAAMTADGHAAETANVLTYVLQQHPNPEHVREIIIQTHLFCGYPRTLNALDSFKQAAEKAKVDLSKLRKDPLEAALDNPALKKRGEALWARVYGANAGRVAGNAQSASPDLAHWSILHGYGSVLSRAEPDALTREFCVVAALVPLDVAPQLKGHVQGVLNLGGTPEQLWKLLGTIRNLFEAPKMFDAAQRVFESVLGKKASDLSFEDEQKLRWS
jgi:alkylhydroperoxidase/carboxymuconolactone decarboxylase family protein YurZ